MAKFTTVKKRKTIYTLAQSVGMSPSTVSKALRDDPTIHVDTRERIQIAARRLNFQPSPIARRLARGRTGLIALLVPSAQNPFFAAFVGALIEATQKMGFEALVSYNPRDVEHEQELAESMFHAPADGLILSPRFGPESWQHLVTLAKRHPGRPIAIRDKVPADCPLDAVYMNMEEAAVEATQHLLNLGHRHICYFGDDAAHPDGPRPTGFARAMRDAGLGFDEEMLVGCQSSTEGAYQATQQLLRDKKPTALVVQGDYLAFSVLRAAKDAGLSLPQDLSVIAFDGIELGSCAPVPLTTMAQPIHEVATMLVDFLVRRIKGDKSPPRRQAFPMRLLERASTAPPMSPFHPL